MRIELQIYFCTVLNIGALIKMFKDIEIYIYVKSL